MISCKFYAFVIDPIIRGRQTSSSAWMENYPAAKQKRTACAVRFAFISELNKLRSVSGCAAAAFGLHGGVAAAHLVFGKAKSVNVPNTKFSQGHEQ